MSRSNWLYCFAIGGFVAACLLLSSESGAQGNATAPSGQPAQQQEATPEGPSIEKAVPGTGYYKPDCKRPKEREDADLCEQIRQAQAAEDAVWWSRLQSYLAMCGFAAVVLSLVFTGWAAWAAGKAANAAERAVAVASESAQRQLRAYLSCEFDPNRPKDQDVKITKAGSFVPRLAKNRGQTPAYQFVHWSVIGIFSKDFRGPFRRVKQHKPRLAPGDIMPGDYVTVVSRGEAWKDEIWDLVLAQKEHVFIYGAFYYRDAFKRRRYTRYCYVANIRPDGELVDIATHEYGNKSN